MLIFKKYEKRPTMKKIVLLVISLSFNTAFTQDISWNDIEKGTPDKDSFSNYITDYCLEIKSNVRNEESLRALGMRRCKDQTVSFVQPDSVGPWEMEGKCGQTASTNMLYMYCRLIASPADYADGYFSDITPGVRPKTLITGLNKMFAKNANHCPTNKGRWKQFNYKNETDYLNAIQSKLANKLEHNSLITRLLSNGKSVKRTPVALLIRSPGGQDLHWITVVDMYHKKFNGKNQCLIVANHWDDQYEVPCTEIARWSRGVRDSYGHLLSQYSVISFEPY
jgi:hypothetical protein